MKLHEAIRLTIEMEDESFIKDERFVNYLADMQAFEGYASNKNIFKQLCQSGYMADIYHMWEDQGSLNESQIWNKFQQMTNAASMKYGFKHDNVLFCLESVAYALNLLSSISVVLKEESDPITDTSLIGYWDFTYKEGKTMQLSISRDGYARASSGTKYNWSLSGNTVNIYMPDLVSYKGEVSGDTITGIACSSYNPLGWEWSAKRRDDGLTKSNLTSGEWMIVNDAEDLEDNKVRFLPDNSLESDLYGKGKWSLEGDELVIVTANEFIKYTGSFVKGVISGKGKNRMSNEWGFKLIKK